MKASQQNSPHSLQQEFEGVVLAHRDGHGFIERADGAPDVYLPLNEMRAVLHKDKVRARIVRLDRKGRVEGRVLEILDRPCRTIVGRLLQMHGVWLVAPEDKRYGQDVLVAKNALGGAKTGQVVVVQLTEAPAMYAQPVGRIVEVLGEVDDPGMEIEIAVRNFDVPHIFSQACLDEAQALPSKVRVADKKGRVDLTDVALVTIDGEDARDFDDAVYCEPYQDTLEDGTRFSGWRLLVAIADVSHYVGNNSAIDRDAYERATSVYFPRRVIPMLPEKLSNGLCSLNPGVDRLCMVADMLIGEDGGIYAYQFYPAVMHSKARLTYTEVAAILQNTKSPQAQERGDLLPHLLHLHSLYRALLAARVERGAMDFDTVETQIVCNEVGRVEKIIPRVRSDAHRLIEEAMLAANVCAADFIAQSTHPSLYRVHEGPTPEKREILERYLRVLGIPFRLSDKPTPKDFQRIAQATSERIDAQQIQLMLLRSMQQAVYSPNNQGHFGLAYEAYTHFTSPIRRYPDLLTHRVIKALLAGKSYALPQLPAATGALDKLEKRLQSNKNSAQAHLAPKKGAAHSMASACTSSSSSIPIPAPAVQQRAGAAQGKNRNTGMGSLAAWEAVGLHCSANERRADEASRDVEAWLKCYYMQSFLGEVFTGTVAGVTTFGLFVVLDTIYVEGLVHISELNGDYYQFDEARQQLRGERTGVCYQLGDKLEVQVSRVDLEARKIDFRLLSANEQKEGRAQQSLKKSVAKRGESATEMSQSKKTATSTAKASAKRVATVKGKSMSSSSQTSHRKIKRKG